MRGIFYFLLMNQSIAFAGQVVVIWPGATSSGTIQIHANVRPKLHLTSPAMANERVVVETRSTQGVVQKITTITPF